MMSPVLSPDILGRYQFHDWYDKFRAITLRSEVIPLDEEFVEFLNADGIYLPESYATEVFVLVLSGLVYVVLLLCRAVP